MQDDKNRKNSTGLSEGMDDLNDALMQADDVISEALRQKELEDAIAETDRAVAELAAQRKKEGRAYVPPVPETEEEEPGEETAETETADSKATDSEANGFKSCGFRR